MKIDKKKRDSTTARRTIHAFFICFSKLLQEEPFEKISVSDICNEAHIPRATFYNYFNDKEDLLASYCSSFLDTMSMKPPAKETNIEEYARYAMRTLLMNLSRDQEVHRRIYQKNEQGKFLQELKHCMHSKLKEYFDSTDQHILDMPMDLEIDLLSNLFITLSEWWLFNSDTYDCEEFVDKFCQLIR